jgi:hypothetical protein
MQKERQLSLRSSLLTLELMVLVFRITGELYRVSCNFWSDLFGRKIIRY